MIGKANILLLSGLWMPTIAEASQVKLDYCQRLYGRDSFIRFEPEESNAIGVADMITGASFPYKRRGTPKPVSFRCLINLGEMKPKKKLKWKCTHGFKPERIGSYAYCGSSSFALKELCPNGLDDTWPEIKEKVCGGDKK